MLDEKRMTQEKVKKQLQIMEKEEEENVDQENEKDVMQLGMFSRQYSYDIPSLKAKETEDSVLEGQHFKKDIVKAKKSDFVKDEKPKDLGVKNSIL